MLHGVFDYCMYEPLGCAAQLTKLAEPHLLQSFIRPVLFPLSLYFFVLSKRLCQVFLQIVEVYVQ